MKLYCEYTALHIEGRWQLRPCLLSIQSSRIESVKEWKAPLKELPPDTVILKNKMLTPAFVNAHTHLAMSLFRGVDLGSSASGNMVKDFFFKLESKLTAEDVRAFTRMGAYECLNFGVGTVWDHYYFGEAVAQALSDVGLTGVVAPTLQDIEGPGKNTWEREWENTERIYKSKNFASKGIVAAWGPHATDTVSEDLWKRLQSDTLPIPMHLHLAQSQEEFYKRKDVSPVRFLKKMGIFDKKENILLAHGIYLQDADKKLLAEHKNAHLVFCPFSQMIFDIPANVLEWERHGISWVVATDTVASNDSMNVQKELRAVSGFPLQSLSYASQNDLKKISTQRKKVWEESVSFRDPSFLLSKVWCHLHPQLKLGSFESQSFANLIVWDLNHPTFWPSQSLRALCFNDSSASIHNMMLAGRWIGKDGSYAQSLVESENYKEHLKEAQERMKFLIK